MSMLFYGDAINSWTNTLIEEGVSHTGALSKRSIITVCRNDIYFWTIDSNNYMKEMGKLDMEFKDLCFTPNGCYLVSRHGTIFKIEDFNCVTPVHPTIFGPSLVIQQIACGLKHCLALTDSGNVYSWGSAGVSLGLGAAITEEQVEGTPVVIPQLVRKLCQVVKICAGDYHSLALVRSKEKKNDCSLSSIGSSGGTGSSMASYRDAARDAFDNLKHRAKDILLEHMVGKSRFFLQDHFEDATCDADQNVVATVRQDSESESVFENDLVLEIAEGCSEEKQRNYVNSTDAASVKAVSTESLFRQTTQAIRVHVNDVKRSAVRRLSYRLQALLLPDQASSQEPAKDEEDDDDEEAAAVTLRRSRFDSSGENSPEKMIPKRQAQILPPLSSKKKSAMRENTNPGLDCVVWSWGVGSQGQLGHGDCVDRCTPCQLHSVIDRQVVDIAASANHSLLLTAGSEVLSFGDNSFGQLGRTGCTRVPKAMLLPMAGLVWNICAGPRTSIISAYIRYRPDLYLVGGGELLVPNQEHTAASPSASTDGQASASGAGSVSQVHRRLTDISKNGWLSHAASFGEEGCLAALTLNCASEVCSSTLQQDNSSSSNSTSSSLPTTSFVARSIPNLVSMSGGSDALIRALHELAATERAFFNRLNRLWRYLVGRIADTDFYERLEASVHGPCMIALFRSQMHMRKQVALNCQQMTATIQNRLKLERTRLFGEKSVFLDDMFQYLGAFCDVLAMNGFEMLEKLASGFIDSLLPHFQELCTSKAEGLRDLFAEPLNRVREYRSVIGPLLTNSSSPNANRFSALASGLDRLSDNKERELQAANQTRDVILALPNKVQTSVYCYKRRVILDSRSMPLTSLKNGKSKSSEIFLLFNDAFVQIQSSTVTQCPLSVLWIDPVDTQDDAVHCLRITSPEESLMLYTNDAEFKNVWLLAFYQSINKVVNMNCMSRRKSQVMFTSPPEQRHGTYTFHQNQQPPGWKDCTYSGYWLSGQAHGQGKLVWPDGTVYIGHLRCGTLTGRGVMTLPCADGVEIREGSWYDGKLHGLSTVKLPCGDVYRGWFVNGLRHGHGDLTSVDRQGHTIRRFVGSWRQNHACGYGVEDELQKGERYLGQWANGQRDGRGLVVNLDGNYAEGTWNRGELQGRGLLLSNDGRCYEGDLSSGQPYGKGCLSTSAEAPSVFGILDALNTDLLPDDGFCQNISGIRQRTILTGSFSGDLHHELKFNGTIKRALLRPSPSSEIELIGQLFNYERPPPNFGKLSVPAKEKWEDVFKFCRTMMLGDDEGTTVGSGISKEKDSAAMMTTLPSVTTDATKLKTEASASDNNVTMQVWNRVAVLISDYKRTATLGSCRDEQFDSLEVIPAQSQQLSYEGLQAIKDYLTLAFESSAHPLGSLMQALSEIFQASYAGVLGSHPRLLCHAVEEVLYFQHRIYNFVRIFFPCLPDESVTVEVYSTSHLFGGHIKSVGDINVIHEGDVTVTEELTSGSLIRQFLLPRIYPTLYSLYVLHNAQENELYKMRISRLNRQCDFALMSFLGVDEEFHFLESETASGVASNDKRFSVMKNVLYDTAVEELQKMSTGFTPEDKMNSIRNTFTALISAVRRGAGQRQAAMLPTDSLLPLLSFAVVRASIPNLGAEIKFIHDLQGVSLSETGYMLTNLAAVYLHIMHERDPFAESHR